ncbi:hypothetical protein BJ138DRAFT_1096984 [Hygrophoropsis aurantiaca]|uniref:Uncharacterized protein n=1 Tax=Hygrophoropsis aurantiaca TaxID=72124 RepID=A0ACB8ASQ8_9AGAM|nr:hypothetical protein BJ138DRAFT_1096984 [Hygrophoropsis aurantiaca]
MHGTAGFRHDSTFNPPPLSSQRQVTATTKIIHARAGNASESASLNGHKAMTPILAGSICGGVIGLAWIIGLVWYLLRRHKRRQEEAKIAAGLQVPRNPKDKTERYIIPPDPAILQGPLLSNQYPNCVNEIDRHNHTGADVTTDGSRAGEEMTVGHAPGSAFK